MRLVYLGATLLDGHFQPMFGINARGHRLVEAAVLGFRHPVDPKMNFIQRLGAQRRDQSCHQGKTAKKITHETSPD